MCALFQLSVFRQYLRRNKRDAPRDALHDGARGGGGERNLAPGGGIRLPLAFCRDFIGLKSIPSPPSTPYPPFSPHSPSRSRRSFPSASLRRGFRPPSPPRFFPPSSPLPFPLSEHRHASLSQPQGGTCTRDLILKAGEGGCDGVVSTPSILRVWGRRCM